MNQDIEKILDKIRKLLRMAADTSSPNEAAIAAGQARRLMDKHQVTLDDLRESNGFGFSKVDKAYRFMPVWKNILSVAVAKFNDCKASIAHEWMTTNNSYSKRLMFQGFEADVAVATAMYEYLVEAIDRLCAKYIAELGYTKYPAKLGDAYKKACADTLCQRLAALQKEREEELKTSTGTALVVFKMAQIEAEFGKPSYRSTKLASRRDTETFMAQRRGRSDGESISLAPQVKGSQAVGALK